MESKKKKDLIKEFNRRFEDICEELEVNVRNVLDYTPQGLVPRLIVSPVNQEETNAEPETTEEDEATTGDTDSE